MFAWHSRDTVVRSAVFNRHSDDMNLIICCGNMWHIKYVLNIYETGFQNDSMNENFA